MEQLIKLVSEKTGISTEQAATAVNTVIGFIKDKLPAGMQSQVESLISGGGAGDFVSGLKEKAGNLFNK